MKHYHFILLSFLFSLNLGAQDSQQSVIASAEDHSENKEIQISWALGEVAVETFSTDSEMPLQSNMMKMASWNGMKIMEVRRMITRSSSLRWMTVMWHGVERVLLMETLV